MKEKLKSMLFSMYKDAISAAKTEEDVHYIMWLVHDDPRISCEDYEQLYHHAEFGRYPGGIGKKEGK